MQKNSRSGGGGSAMQKTADLAAEVLLQNQMAVCYIDVDRRISARYIAKIGELAAAPEWIFWLTCGTGWKVR